MSLEYRLLSESEIGAAIAARPTWQVIDGKLAKTWTFSSYKDGLVFATAVGFVADGLDHHPDIAIGYQKVHVAMNTHAVGGLSPYDLALADKIDAL